MGDQKDLFIGLHIAQLVLVVGLGHVLWLLIGVGTAQPQAWRDGITHVAIDLSTSHARAVREDRFHLIRLASDTVTASANG